MRAIRQICLASALIALGAAPAGAQEMKAEVIHWWTSGGESAAVKVFADKFTEAGGTWIDTAIAGGENARTAGINRIVGGNPPTAMQFNTGKQFDELVAEWPFARPRRPRRRRTLAEGAAGGDPQGDHPRRQGLRRAGQHPRPELALVQHQDLQGRRPRAAQDLRRPDRARAQAQGRRRDPARPGRPALAGAAAVQRGPAGGRRARRLSLGADRRGSRRGPQRRLPQGRRDLRRAARAGRRGQRRAATGTTRPTS